MSCAHDAARVGGQCPACLLSLAIDEDAALAPGTMVAGRFRIVAPLGRGGMGEVYRADDLKLGHAVALKFVQASDATLREVRAGREISHPNVCRIYDVVDVDASAAIVMEYVEGEDLTAWDRLKPVPTLGIVRDICNGLEAIHERGLVHGDLKPANVMIDARGRARITDLGLASRAGEASRFGGTPAYMAPEQFETRAASRQSDIYALGLILAELLPDHEIIERCLSRDPAARPASAREVLAAIDAGEAPSPEYLAASEHVTRPSARQLWALAAAAVALLALLVALYPRPRTEKTHVLAARARQLARVVPVDEAYWFADDLTFHYRSSPRPMRALRGEVTDDDPPFDLPGMKRVTLAADGAAISIQSAPQLTESSSSPAIVFTVLLTLILVAGAVFAWRNLRAGRVDRAGATRVALWVFACEALSEVIAAHHPPSLLNEAEMLTAIAGAAALLAAEVWLGYAALEPYARGDCPHALVSWMRLLRRRVADPLVARDVLAGVAAGITIRLLDLPRGTRTYAEALTSSRIAIGSIAHSLARGVFYALFSLFLLVLLRMLLKRPAIAAVVWLIATTAAWSDTRADVLSIAAQMLLILFILQRLGLLAAAVAISAHMMTLFVPLTVLPQAAIVLAVLAAMIVLPVTNRRAFLH